MISGVGGFNLNWSLMYLGREIKSHFSPAAFSTRLVQMMHLSRAIGTSGEEEKGQERSGCTKRWAVSDMYPPLRDTADLKRGCTHTSPLHPNRGLQIQLRVTEATNPAWLPKVHGCYLKGPGTTGQNDTHCLGQKKGELGLYKHCTGRWSRRRRPYAPAQLHQCAISTVAGSSRCSRRFPSFQKCDYLGFFLKKNQDAAGRGGMCVCDRRYRCRGAESHPPHPRLSLETLIALVIGHREGSELRHARIIMEISPHSHGSELAPNHPCRAAFLAFY